MARTMSAEEYQALGKRYYKHKEYEKAVTAFTDGIECTLSPSVNLFDNRAATYEKIGDLKSAVRDGRDMIRIDKKDIRGYLRTGNVLQKMNKPDAAIGIYKYGIKNVPVDNKHFKLLQGMLDKLTRQLAPPKAVDPFTVLPVELIEMVISYLSFKNMVNCTRVSKAWKKYLINRPNLWTDLDLSHATKPVGNKFVQYAIRRSQYMMTRATIHRFSNTDVLRNLATSCKGLSDLEFLSGMLMSDSICEITMCAVNLKKLVYNIDVSLDTVTQILRYRPTLAHVEFTSINSANLQAQWKVPMPNLQTLYLKATIKPTLCAINLNPRALLSQTPDLKSLNLTNWAGGHNHADLDFASLPLTHLTLQNSEVSAFPLLPETLTHLSLHPWIQLPLPTTAVQNLNALSDVSWQNALKSHLPNLTHLTLSHFSDLTPEFLSTLLEKCENEAGTVTHIETLDSTPVSNLSHFSLAHSLPHIETSPAAFLSSSTSRILTRHLRSLDLSTMPVTDEGIDLITTHLPSLQTINLTSSRITGAGVKTLVDKMPHLSSLAVDFCRHITSPDAINYAKRQGVSVSWKLAEQMGGRRVRYG